MLSHLITPETLLRLAVFILLGFVFWGLSLRFPMRGFGLQKVKLFDGFFIFMALLLAGLAERFFYACRSGWGRCCASDLAERASA